MRFETDIFAEAKKISCAQLVEAEGVALRRSGDRMSGACPLCGGDRKATRFGVTLSLNLWICRACGEGGSSIDLEMALRGGSELEAAKRLAGMDFERISTSPAKTVECNQKSKTAPMAQRLWREAKPARGTIVEAWLRARGIEPALVQEPLGRLRFHPNAFLAGEKKAIGKGWLWVKTAPAMIAPIISTNDGGRLIGVHATYLSADGKAKAGLRDPKGEELVSRKMWGQSAGGVCPLTSLDRAHFASPDYALVPPLFVGEGLETTLSALAFWTARNETVRAAAVLSLDNLQGGWLKDKEGCATAWPPKSDAAKPPWTLQNPGAVVTIIDRDMAPITLKRRDESGKVRRVKLDGEARAQMCADLASQAWRRAGATEISCALPITAGADLNDMMKAQA